MEEIDYTVFNMSALGGDYEAEDDMRLNDSSETQVEMKKKLEDAEAYWQALHEVRKRRKRSRDFYRGKQWEDIILDPNDNTLKTEETYLLEQGKQPLVNNQVRQLVKNLLGQFRDNDYKPQARSRKRVDATVSEMMTNAIQYVYDINELKELDTRAFEEYLLSGIICWKTSFSWMKERNIEEVEEDVVNPNYLFWNTETRDIRGKDIRMIGEIVDAPLEDILAAFAKDEEEETIIKKWYGDYERRKTEYYSQQNSDREDTLDFYYPLDNTLCRYYEIWELKHKQKIICHDWLKGTYYQHPLDNQQAIEQIETENQQRIIDAYTQYVNFGSFAGSYEEFVVSDLAQQVPLIDYEIKNNEPVWCFYMITPDGFVLDSGETPYEHEEHPYTLRLFPLIDGEVWGFVEDIIDQQKMINRMVTLIDFVISAGAKGLLMIPQECIPEGMTEDDFSDQWRKHNGVIVYKPSKTGAKPEAVYNQSLPAGATELLSIQLNLLKEISGVTGAIQGQAPDSGTPASRYAMETQNAAIASKDYFEHFFSARKKRDFKILKVVKQFYQEERYINISGMDYSDAAAVYQPELVQDIDFDMVIGKSSNAPVHRMMIDDTLRFLLEAGQIDAGLFLENTSMPFADKLLQDIKEKQEALAQMQPADPNAMALANQFTGQPGMQVA